MSDAAHSWFGAVASDRLAPVQVWHSVLGDTVRHTAAAWMVTRSLDG